MPRATRSARSRQSDPPAPSERIRALLSWFEASARELLWREFPAGRRPFYPVLVSELMLQQTQVSRVREIYPRFMARFPTVESLAAAEESEVLAAWTGLGYYRRARHLHAAARAIVRDHGSELPPDPRAIRALPGVGAYTAGAIASLCFDLPTPAVDTNVQRVLQRLFAFDDDPRSPAAGRWARERASELLASPASRGIPGGAGRVNEALIELGALICTPRAPACDRCPLREGCLARQRGLAEDIPPAARRVRRTPIYCASVIVRDARDRVLIEQRPSDGLWASMHQAPTIERNDRPPRPREVRELLPIGELRERARFSFQTTHRDLSFVIYSAARRPGTRLATGGRRWIAPSQLDRLALSSPQRRILTGSGSIA